MGHFLRSLVEMEGADTLYFAAPVEAGSSYALRAVPRGAVPTDVDISVQTPDV